MKKQKNGLSINTDGEWPIEDMLEKIRINRSHNHREISQQNPSKAKDQAALTADQYRHAVAEMAYGLWEKRGYAHGGSDADWLQAEAALKSLLAPDISN